jgi:hypothetical protein
MIFQFSLRMAFEPAAVAPTRQFPRIPPSPVYNGVTVNWEEQLMRKLSLCAFRVSCLTLIVFANAQPIAASVCHDGNWDAGEFCGRDAYLVTGDTEMNHDCKVDSLDLRLFAPEFGLFGSSMSGDFDGNGFVNLVDLLMMKTSFGNSVSPCTRGGMLSDRCAGTIALSFNSDPTMFVATQTQSTGSHRVYVVVEGWANAQIIEYAVETSSNVNITSHPPTSYSHWTQADIHIPCDPDQQHSWRSFVLVSGSWATGPIAYNFIDYDLLDENPAWIKLTPVPSCWNNDRIRWGKAAADQSIDFLRVYNAGINGPAPQGGNTCSLALVPALEPPLPWFFAGILVVIGVAILARRSRATA